jgi:hypothetical protein
VEVPGGGTVEADEDGLLIAACFSGLLEFNVRVAVLAEHPLERDVGEDLLPADGTPEELKQCLTVSTEYFKTHHWTDPVEPGQPSLPGHKTARSVSAQSPLDAIDGA